MIRTTSSGIPYQLRDRYAMCRCCWNVETYKWKTLNEKAEILSLATKL
jgi:hypothetical protein